MIAVEYSNYQEMKKSKKNKKKNEREKLEDEMAERLARILLMHVGVIPNEHGRYYKSKDNR